MTRSTSERMAWWTVFMPLGDIWTWVNDNGAGLQAIAVIVTGLVAVAALFRTAEDSRERSRPMVTAELQRGPNSHSVIDLVVRNSGLTVARDLAVRLDPLPVVPAEGGPYVTPFMLRRYAQPIPVLAPGQELRNIWWSGEVVTGSIELQNREPTTDEVKVSVTYRGPARRRYSDTYSLHVDIVKMTTYEVSSDSLPGRLETIDKSLRRLSAAATSIASQLGRSPASPTSRSHET